MNPEITTEKLGKSQIKLEIKVAKKDFDEYRKKALERLKAEVEIAGFRKGKAPDKMVIEKLGETRVESEALDMTVRESTFLAMAKENIIPIESPKVAIKQFAKDKDLCFTIEVSILPQVILGNYKNIKIKKETVKVEKEEVDKAIEDLRKRMATPIEKKEGLERGDFAEIDFEGSVKGVKLDKLSSQKMPLVVGEIKFIPGFEEKLMGMKKGEEREFELTLPKEGVDDDLKGQQAKFKVKLNELKAIQLPELNQEFAQRLGASEIGDLKKRMEGAIKNQKELEIENKYKIALIDKVAAKTKIEIPESLVNQEKERLIGEFSRQLSMSGMTVEQFLAGQKKTKENLDKDFIIQAEKNVRIGLTLAEISKAENIEATATEIDEEIDRLINEGMSRGLKKSDLVKSYENEAGKRQIEHLIKNKKTIERIAELNS
ncbi:MAG: trigger factor [Candidatus Berkelbacteria bacterium Licking1014_96]|uniref:Trigger factor n=1 Tax=Candidatus Berkelbacteria bacterium Licking1014_96 TaxID=2017149 RepID=A0A554LFP0_9BACT|nr:MAG: trigger factor [Candidatus Berkelbacteria bacterium Licking1014_96]